MHSFAEALTPKQSILLCMSSNSTGAGWDRFGAWSRRSQRMGSTSLSVRRPGLDTDRGGVWLAAEGKRPGAPCATSFRGVRESSWMAGGLRR